MVDYTKDPYNLNGRIALIPSMFWGIFLSLIMFDFLQPFATMLIEMVPKEVGYLHRIRYPSAHGCRYGSYPKDRRYAISFRQQLENAFWF